MNNEMALDCAAKALAETLREREQLHAKDHARVTVDAYLAAAGSEQGAGRAPKPPTASKDVPPVFAYLLGEGELDGRWFGDEPPRTKSGHRQPYWWRKYLRAALEGITPVRFDEMKLRNNIRSLLAEELPETEKLLWALICPYLTTLHMKAEAATGIALQVWQRESEEESGRTLHDPFERIAAFKVDRTNMQHSPEALADADALIARMLEALKGIRADKWYRAMLEVNRVGALDAITEAQQYLSRKGKAHKHGIIREVRDKGWKSATQTLGDTHE